MKKSPKKLTLDRETLRRLDEVKGGAAGEPLVQMADDQSLSCVFCYTVPDHSC